MIINGTPPRGIHTPYVVEAVTYVAVVKCSGPLPPDFADWPAKLQDQVQAAVAQVEALDYVEKGVRRSFSIIETFCDKDEDGWFVRISIQGPPVWKNLL